jgi:hypothetical protein
MSPLLRVVIAAVSIGGVCLFGWLALRAAAENFTAMRSWRRVAGRIDSQNGKGGWLWEPDGAYVMAFPTVDRDVEGPALRVKAPIMTDLGLPGLADRFPLYIDPADPKRAKTAGFFQMWTFPAVMLAWVLLFLAIGAAGWMLGRGAAAPGPFDGGIALHNPPGYWKTALLWSLLGVALFALALHPGGGFSRTKAISGAAVGALFAMSVWVSAWRDATWNLTANDSGVRVISITGWKDVAWSEIKGFERQSIFTTYLQGIGWSMPAPGSVVEVYALLDRNGHTLTHFGLDVGPSDMRRGFMRLCEAKAGVTVTLKDAPIRY